MGNWSHEPPNKSICSVCQDGEGEEKRNPSESVRHIHLCPEAGRAGRALPAATAQPHSAHSLGCSPGLAIRGPLAGVSLSQPSLSLPAFDSPVRVLV